MTDDLEKLLDAYRDDVLAVIRKHHPTMLAYFTGQALEKVPVGLRPTLRIKLKEHQVDARLVVETLWPIFSKALLCSLIEDHGQTLTEARDLIQSAFTRLALAGFGELRGEP